jgi:lipopolysaccharide assembly protein B
MTDYALLAVLLALLLGLVTGKAWERYKLRDGRWIDRRRLRETPHYMLGLNFLVDNQVDQAVDELTRAASTESDALEIQMILGNLYRQKGQVGRAITVHQGLLQRADLRPIEHAHVLLCLGLDYKHGGFIDRALETFQEVVRLDPTNRYAFVNLQKLYEDQHQWAEAASVREQIALIDTKPESNNQILGFLRNEVGETLMNGGEDRAAARSFETAIDIDARTAPAYLNLGDARERMGQTAAAVDAWEKLVQTLPDRAYLALDRLERAYRRGGTPHRFAEMCARPGNPPGGVEGIARPRSRSRARPVLHGAHTQRGLLPRPARVLALPIPEHGAALAMPAMPRVEYVRRRTDVDGQGHRSCRRWVAGR